MGENKKQVMTLKGENWKTVSLDFSTYKKVKIQVSNLGRAKSFKRKTLQNGQIISPPSKSLFFNIKIKHINGGYKNLNIKTLIAETFLIKPSNEHSFVIEKNHDKRDLSVTNLEWVTKKEQVTHSLSNPNRKIRKKKTVVIKPDIPEGDPLQLEGEVWKPIIFPDHILKKEVFHISNLGRIKSFKRKKQIGKILKPNTSGAFAFIEVLDDENDKEPFSLHKLAALAFLNKPSLEHLFIIHKDHNQKDFSIQNLQWATKEEKEAHYLTKPKRKSSSLKKPRKLTRKDKEDIPEGDPLQLDGEVWVNLHLNGDLSDNQRFHISNLGRVKSFNIKPRIGKIIKQGSLNHYHSITTRKKDGKTKGHLIHRLVAQYFLEKPSEEHTFVIHKNYDKLDNNAFNLAWATKREKEQHQFSNPKHNSRPYSKLTEGQVRIIKRKLADPERKTRLKMIAKNFGISEMQLYRISSGENWGYVKI
jgi:hypothetical protein